MPDHKIRFEEHDEDGEDQRCQHQKWGARLSLLKQLEALACLAIAEHMDETSWQNVCVAAWERSVEEVESATATVKEDDTDSSKPS